MISPYIQHYQNIGRIYPSALALKIFLGKSPLFNFRSIDFTKHKILDLGFGDGRDLKLFCDLGFETYGCEPYEEVIKHTLNKGISPDIILKVGANDALPFSDNFFDFIYASASIYYLSSLNVSVRDALNEARRCLKKGGYLIFTATTSHNHYIESAKKISNNIYQLTDPFFNQRPNQLVHVYGSPEEISGDLIAAGFEEGAFIGNFYADWFGVSKSLYIVVARKS